MKEAIYCVAAAIFIPLLPAVILYWLLPSKTNLSGNSKLVSFFNNLGFQLTGAFAGYFLLVLVAFYYINAWANSATFKIYTVEGRLGLSSAKLKEYELYSSPVNYDLNPDGSFSFSFYMKNELGNMQELPHLVIGNTEKYQLETIDLRNGSAAASGHSYRITRDAANNRIKIEEAIELLKVEEFPQYNSTQPSQLIGQLPKSKGN